MCGWLFMRGKDQRRVEIDTLRARVRAQWCDGPIVFPAIMGHPGPTALCCATCLKRPGPTDVRMMLPMDAYLLYLMAPTQAPDLRRQNRMRATLLRTVKGFVNPYACPRWVLSIAAAEQPVRAWWERNLRTEFFAHKHTARAVRLAMRAQGGGGASSSSSSSSTQAPGNSALADADEGEEEVEQEEEEESQ